MTPQQEKLLKRVDAKLTALLNRDIVPEQPIKGTWVTATIVADLTGWTNIQLFRARKEGLVTFKRADSGGYRYLVESINDKFIKKVS